jgi:hypothetical protein
MRKGTASTEAKIRTMLAKMICARSWAREEVGEEVGEEVAGEVAGEVGEEAAEAAEADPGGAARAGAGTGMCPLSRSPSGLSTMRPR